MEFNQEKFSTRSYVGEHSCSRQDKQQPIIIQNFDLSPSSQLKFRRKPLSTANLYLSAASLSRKRTQSTNHQLHVPFSSYAYPAPTTANLPPGMKPGINDKPEENALTSAKLLGQERDRQSRHQQVTFVDIPSIRDTITAIDKTSLKRPSQLEVLGKRTDKSTNTFGTITIDLSTNIKYEMQNITKTSAYPNFTSYKGSYQTPSYEERLSDNTQYPKLSMLDSGLPSSPGCYPVENTVASNCKVGFNVCSEIGIKTPSENNLKAKGHLQFNENERQTNYTKEECLVKKMNMLNVLQQDVVKELVSDTELADAVGDTTLRDSEERTVINKKTTVKSKRVSFKLADDDAVDKEKNNSNMDAVEIGQHVFSLTDLADTSKNSLAKPEVCREGQYRRWRANASSDLPSHRPASSVNQPYYQSPMSSDIMTTIVQNPKQASELRNLAQKGSPENASVSEPVVNRLKFLRNDTEFYINKDGLSYQNKSNNQKIVRNIVSNKQDNIAIRPSQFEQKSDGGISDQQDYNPEDCVFEVAKYGVTNESFLIREKSKSEVNSEFLMKIYSASGERMRPKDVIGRASDPVVEAATSLQNQCPRNSKQVNHLRPEQTCIEQRDPVRNSPQTRRKSRPTQSATSFGCSRKERHQVRFASAKGRTMNTREKMAAVEQYLFMTGSREQDRTTLNKRLEQLIVESLRPNKT